MKKVLLVGELNQVVGGLYKHMSTQFQTQICVDNIEMIKGMTKIFRPDMVVVCLIGIGELDGKILSFLSANQEHIPVLFVGTSEECAAYQKYYETGRFDCIIRPTTQMLLLQKCSEMMKMAVPVEEEPEEVQEIKRRRILAVDDSGVLLRSVKAMLEKHYDVAVANSGIMALKQAKKKVPDLILLDYEMPEWDGRKTLEEIRNDEELKDVPVVFLTAVADKAHIAAVLELRPSGYLLKPVDQQALIDAIERAVVEI